jgi:hypothetical protein
MEWGKEEVRREASRRAWRCVTSQQAGLETTQLADSACMLALQATLTTQLPAQ